MVGSCAAEMVLFQLGPDQNVVPTPISRGLLPSSPILSHPPAMGQGQRGRGLGKELMSSSLSVLLFWGPTGPSLTLASAPLTREHRGPPFLRGIGSHAGREAQEHLMTRPPRAGRWGLSWGLGACAPPAPAARSGTPCAPASAGST